VTRSTVYYTVALALLAGLVDYMTRSVVYYYVQRWQSALFLGMSVIVSSIKNLKLNILSTLGFRSDFE